MCPQCSPSPLAAPLTQALWKNVILFTYQNKTLFDAVINEINTFLLVTVGGTSNKLILPLFCVSYVETGFLPETRFLGKMP